MDTLFPLRPTQLENDTLVANIMRCYWTATPDQRQRGMHWYQTAHDLAKIIGTDVSMGAGLLAALSANKSWHDTVKLSIHAGSGNPIRTLSDQQRKVRLILAGADPVTILPMEVKTGQFYQCIMNPDHPTAVVIDRHAHDIARGRAYGDFNRGLSYLKRYRIFADAYRRAAAVLKLTPCQLQAVTWVVWTERNL